MKPAWPTPSPSTRPCSSPSDEVRAFGWSVMINNSPRSAQAASSATSHKPTVRCISQSCTASPTPPKQQHHSPSAKASRPRSTFYLDHDRIHVGDIAKTTEDAFTAWVQDRSAGLDAIMLAPTRDLVA